MNAREIVNLLLEADQPSAGDRSGVYVFGPYLPDEGYSTPSIEQAVEEFRRFGIIPAETQDRGDMLDQLVKIGYTFFLKKAPGDIEVIGRVPAKTNADGQERASVYLGLEKHERVQYRRTPTSTPTSLDVEQVLYGTKEHQERRDAIAKEKEAQAKKRRTVHSKYWGPIDPEEEGFQAPPTGVGYQEGDMMPLNAPVQIGVTFNQDSKNGVDVVEVHPAGPAAQAGLQAGDRIIEVGKFARRDGKEPKAYGIKAPNHLEFVLRIADPQYPIPFRIQRGDEDKWLPIQPEQKPEPQGEQGTVIPAAEVQAYAKGQAQPQAPAEPTRPQASPPRPTAKQMVLGLRGVKPKQAQRRLPLRYPPNQPTPARETGNAGANVSSLT